MLTNEELDAEHEILLDSTLRVGDGVFAEILAKAKEANALREQLATARRDALEEAAKICKEIADRYASTEMRITAKSNSDFNFIEGVERGAEKCWEAIIAAATELIKP